MPKPGCRLAGACPWSNRPRAALPEPRYDYASFTNSGAIHVVGGYDADSAVVSTDLFAVPSATNGSITGWHELEATVLPAPRAEAAAAVVGQHVFVIGGTSDGKTLRPVDDPGRHCAAPAVLPARAVRRDGSGAVDQGRDRPAAGLHRCRVGRARELRGPRDHRVDVLEQSICPLPRVDQPRPVPRPALRTTYRSHSVSSDKRLAAVETRRSSRATTRCHPRPGASTARSAGRWRAPGNRSARSRSRAG